MLPRFAVVMLAACGRFGFDAVSDGRSADDKNGDAAGAFYVEWNGTGDVRGRGLALDPAGNVYVIGQFAGDVDLGGGTLTSAGLHDGFLASFDPAGQHRWSMRFGGTGDDDGRLIALDAAMNQIVIAGSIQGTADFGGGPLTSTAGSQDIFLAAFTAFGTHLWSRRYGDAGDELTRGIAVDDTGAIYLTGFVVGNADLGAGPFSAVGTEDTYVASYTSSGAYRWAQSYGVAGNTDRGRGVAISGSRVFATGCYSSGTDFGGGAVGGSGDWDTYVLGLDASTGVYAWANGFPSSGSDWGSHVVADASGNAYVVGYFAGTSNFGDGVVTPNGAADVFVITHHYDGTYAWSRTYGSPGCDYGAAIALGGGALFISGYEGGGIDFGTGVLPALGGNDGFVAELATNGTTLNAQSFGGATNDSAYALAIAPDGHAWVTGYVDPNPIGCGDPNISVDANGYLRRL